MAEQPEKLIILNKFAGIDLTTLYGEFEPGYAASATNVNPTIVDKGLGPERGRKLLYDFSSVLDSISVIVPVTFGVVGTNAFGGFVVGGLKTGTFKAFIYSDYTSGSITQVTSISNAQQFDQAVQYGGVLYTNGGQRLFCLNSFGATLYSTLYAWQYPPPVVAFKLNLATLSYNGGVTVNAALASVASGFVTVAVTNTTGMTAGQNVVIDSGSQQEIVNLNAVNVGTSIVATFNKSHDTGALVQAAFNPGTNPEQVFYLATTVTVMPDGTTSESSVDLNQYQTPPSITVGNGQAVTVTPIGGFSWSGTHSLDPLTWTSNLYRLSSLQPTYQLVASGLTGTGAYTDISPDTAIAGNVTLQPQRDQPPCVMGSYGVGAASFNYMALAVHKGRVWLYGVVQTTSTQNFPQNQLWYSNLGRPWEFNQLTQVLLMQAAETNQYATAPNYNTTYDDLYGDDPLALSAVGSNLMALARQETWGVIGDNPSNFVQRNLFNIGTVSRHSVTPALGGYFSLSENGGPYFFQGQDPQYIAGKIVSLFQGNGGNAPISAYDQSQSTGVYAKQVWYLCFPTLGVSYGYHAVSGKWLSKLLYAPQAPGAICYTPSRPDQYSAGGTVGGLNEVVAARPSGGGVVAGTDYWFADQNNDLGSPQTFTWVGPYTVSESIGGEKQYAMVTLTVAPGTQGSAEVIIQADSHTQWSYTIADLSKTTRHIKGIGVAPPLSGKLRGFMAYAAVVVTGAAGQPAPVIWDVTVWGAIPKDRVLVLTDALGGQ